MDSVFYPKLLIAIFVSKHYIYSDTTVLLDHLWTDIAVGDKEAYSEVYVYCYRRFYNYGCKFTDDVSLIEDALQEVLIKVWELRHKLQSIDAPYTYFLTVFRNDLIKRMQLAHKARLTHSPEPEPDFSIDSIIVKREADELTRRQIKAALAGLTPRQREAIFLRFYEGLSYAEVSEMMGISVKAVYKLMARSLCQLKESLSIPLASVLCLLRAINASL
ncbi:MAG TPA: RNA polymerase sigma factor [Chitinophagaceae bacterium]